MDNATNVNIFEEATKRRLRFAYRGLLTVEDLWDLLVDDLDKIYKNLRSKIKENSEDSLLGPKESPEAATLNLQIAIVKHIVAFKLNEIAERDLAAEKRTKREKIYEILAEAQDKELRSKTAEELTKMLEEL